MSDVTEKIETFFAAYSLRKYRKGQVLLLSGEKSQYVYHLLSGTVKQYDVSYRGDEVILNLFKPPAFFPMSGAINGSLNAYILEAETDVEIRQAPVAHVVTFIKENPDVLYDLLSRVYRGLDGLLARMAYLMTGTASSRLMHELVIEGRRFGKPVAGGGSVIALSEKDLGARAGLTRETVSREIGKLKKAGLIDVNSRGLRIKNIDEFEKHLAGDG
jgi:CRP-like cAMP-binding protein